MPKLYSEKFKRDVVMVTRPRDRSMVEVVAGFGISTSTLKRWIASSFAQHLDLHVFPPCEHGSKALRSGGLDTASIEGAPPPAG